jgi:hypothetical protein
LFTTVGALVVSRQADNPIGWLMWGIGASALLGVSGFGYGYVAYALERPFAGLPAVAWAAWITNSTNPAGFVFAGLLFLLFPTGRPASRVWRPIVRGGALLTLVAPLSTALRPGPIEYFPTIDNPLGVEGAIGDLGTIASTLTLLVILALFLMGAASLLLRLHRAVSVERQQIKWFAYSATLVAVVYGLMDVSGRLWPELSEPGPVSTLVGIAWALAVVSMPLAIGVAVLRYRLYEIDRIINRTLVYGVLTLFLGLCYWLSVVVLQQVLRPLTQGSDLAIVGSTLAVAALFQPLRQRIQRTVDRRFYRQRYNAAQTLQAFSSRLREDVDIDSLGAELLGAVGQTMKPTRMSLWLRPPVARNDRR